MVKCASPFGPCFRGKAYLYDHIVDLNVPHRCAIRTICEALRRICYGQGMKHGRSTEGHMLRSGSRADELSETAKAPPGDELNKTAKNRGEYTFS